MKTGEHDATKSGNNGLQKTVETIVQNLKEGEHKSVTILTGTVTEEERTYDKKLTLSGTLPAPFEFYNKRKLRKQKHDEQFSHLIINKAKGTMKLVLDEIDHKSKPQTTIHGRLEKNPDYVALEINSQRMFGVKELMQHLKFNRAFFTERSRCEAIVTNLMNFTLNIEKEIQAHDDLKGNVLHKIEQKVKQDINLNFTVTINLFKGTPAKTFDVVANVQVTATSCSFWLESVDAREIETVTRNTAIDEQVALFNDEIVVIEQTSADTKGDD